MKLYKTDKLKPTQPFFVLNTSDFMQAVYLKQGISHFYSFVIDEMKEISAVPDGCIDIVFVYEEDNLSVYAYGSVLKYKDRAFDPGIYGRKEIFGIRFMPGNRPAGLNLKLKDLVENEIDLSDDNYGKHMVSLLKGEKDFYQRIRLFLQEYTKFEKESSHLSGKEVLAITIKNMIYDSNGLIRVSQMADQTGYSERYINMIFIEEMGFSPKVFCKIIQFQRSIEFLNYGSPDKMTEAAVNLGYYDQAKFIKDFKSFSGITPKQYLKLVEKRNYSSKISEKMIGS